MYDATYGLPIEMWKHVLDYLNPEDLKLARPTCRLFRDLKSLPSSPLPVLDTINLPSEFDPYYGILSSDGRRILLINKDRNHIYLVDTIYGKRLPTRAHANVVQGTTYRWPYSLRNIPNCSFNYAYIDEENSLLIYRDTQSPNKINNLANNRMVKNSAELSPSAMLTDGQLTASVFYLDNQYSVQVFDNHSKQQVNSFELNSILPVVAHSEHFPCLLFAFVKNQACVIALAQEARKIIICNLVTQNISSINISSAVNTDEVMRGDGRRDSQGCALIACSATQEIATVIFKRKLNNQAEPTAIKILHIYSMQTGQLSKVIEIPNIQITAFSADGRYLIGHGHGTYACIVNTATGHCTSLISSEQSILPDTPPTFLLDSKNPITITAQLTALLRSTRDITTALVIASGFVDNKPMLVVYLINKRSKPLERLERRFYQLPD